MTGNEETAPDARATRRRWVAPVAVAVVLVAAVGGAIGYTAHTVGDADRTAGAPVWTPPRAATDDETKESASGLSGALVPYRPDGWTRGPDLGEFGADAELSGAHAAALTKESLNDLPRSQRRALEKEIDRRHISGVAMRSYATTGGFHNGEHTGAATVAVVLTRMNQEAARSGAVGQNEFFEALDGLEAGPAVKGHKSARCYHLPGESDEELDIMFCSAHQADVLVSAVAEGVPPFGAKGVAALLAEQLDRIGGTGEAV
ncbi:hypothetical protein [Streptomyces parvulus]|uniref:hypothetical protein n=1 Tax=Streptomyces parvulus TaxID=146923 RepID=UPI0033AD9507